MDKFILPEPSGILFNELALELSHDLAGFVMDRPGDDLTVQEKIIDIRYTP